MVVPHFGQSFGSDAMLILLPEAATAKRYREISDLEGKAVGRINLKLQERGVH